jgi:hypothetical protein
LKQHKQSAFFVDRTDIMIAAEKGVPSETIAHAIEVACTAGFIDVAILSPDLLTAVPSL